MVNEYITLPLFKVKNEFQKKSHEELTRATEEIEAAQTECLNVTKELVRLKSEYEQLRVHSKTTQESEVFVRDLEVRFNFYFCFVCPLLAATFGRHKPS